MRVSAVRDDILARYRQGSTWPPNIKTCRLIDVERCENVVVGHRPPPESEVFRHEIGKRIKVVGLAAQDSCSQFVVRAGREPPAPMSERCPRLDVGLQGLRRCDTAIGWRHGPILKTLPGVPEDRGDQPYFQCGAHVHIGYFPRN